MPTYVYLCPKCGKEMAVKRLFSQFEDPTQCLDCGAQVTRQFTPPPAENLHIPLHMQAKHGGGLSWSDFYGDTTEKELAKDPHVNKLNRQRSQPGRK